MAHSAFEDSSSGESSSEETGGGDRASSPESDESSDDEVDFVTGSILSLIRSQEALNPPDQQLGELTDFSSLVRRAPPSEYTAGLGSGTGSSLGNFDVDSAYYSCMNIAKLAQDSALSALGHAVEVGGPKPHFFIGERDNDLAGKLYIGKLGIFHIAFNTQVEENVRERFRAALSQQIDGAQLPLTNLFVMLAEDDSNTLFKVVRSRTNIAFEKFAAVCSQQNIEVMDMKVAGWKRSVDRQIERLYAMEQCISESSLKVPTALAGIQLDIGHDTGNHELCILPEDHPLLHSRNLITWMIRTPSGSNCLSRYEKPPFSYPFLAKSQSLGG